MGDIVFFAVLERMFQFTWIILKDPILLGIAGFFGMVSYLSVVIFRQFSIEKRHKDSTDIGLAETGQPIWVDDVESKLDGVGQIPEPVMRISRTAHLGFSGVGEVRMTDNGVVSKSEPGFPLGELCVDGSGMTPFDLGIWDMECYIERHRHRIACDLDVWLPHINGQENGDRYVSMFDMPGTLPKSLSERERIYRMWMLTVSDKQSILTTVYVPFVPFRTGSVTTCKALAARIVAGQFNAGDYLDLHTRGEWGEIRTIDAIRNEFSALTGHGPIRSRHRVDHGSGEFIVDVTTRDDRHETHLSLVGGDDSSH